MEMLRFDNLVVCSYLCMDIREIDKAYTSVISRKVSSRVFCSYTGVGSDGSVWGQRLYYVLFVCCF